jgi:hypothetical protein
MLDKVQKPSNSVYYTPSSEPFRIYSQSVHSTFGIFPGSENVDYGPLPQCGNKREEEEGKSTPTVQNY